MALSKYQKQNIDKIKIRAIELHKQGLSLRQIEKIVGKSYEWVRQAIKELTGLDTVEK